MGRQGEREHSGKRGAWAIRLPSARGKGACVRRRARLQTVWRVELGSPERLSTGATFCPLTLPFSGCICSKMEGRKQQPTNSLHATQHTPMHMVRQAIESVRDDVRAIYGVEQKPKSSMQVR